MLILPCLQFGQRSHSEWIEINWFTPSRTDLHWRLSQPSAELSSNFENWRSNTAKKVKYAQYIMFQKTSNLANHLQRSSSCKRYVELVQGSWDKNRNLMRMQGIQCCYFSSKNWIWPEFYTWKSMRSGHFHVPSCYF